MPSDAHRQASPLPPLPASITSRGGTTYRLYKEATAALSDWLVKTVKQRRLVSTLSSWTNSSTTKQQQQQTPRQGHSLKVDQFLFYTTLITDADPVIRIPAKIVELAYVTMNARKERNRIMKGQDEESDRRHEHMITVCSQVYLLLQDHFQSFGSDVEKEKQKTRRGNTDGQEREGGMNESGNASQWHAGLFSLLEEEGEDEEEEEEEEEEEGIVQAVEASRAECKDHPKGGGKEGEESEREEEKESGSSPTKKRKKKNKSKKVRDKLKNRAVDPSDSRQESDGAEEEEDPYFVLYCLLCDLSHTRYYLFVLWTLYQRRKIDLSTVSLITNATFDIVRTYEVDVPALKPLLEDYPKAIARLFQQNPFKRGSRGDLFDIAHQERILPSLYDEVDLSTLSFANVAYLLNHTRLINVALETPGTKPNEALLTSKHESGGRPAESTRSYLHDSMLRNSGGEGSTYEEKNSNNKYDKKSKSQKVDKTEWINRWRQEAGWLHKFALSSTLPPQVDLTKDHVTEFFQSDERVSERPVTLLQAFAAQVYCDIRERLGDDQMENGYLDLFKAGLQIRNTFDIFDRSNQVGSPIDLVSEHQKSRDTYSTCLFRAAIAKKESLSKAIDEIFRHGSFSESQSLLRSLTGGRTALELNPLLCGIWLFQIRHIARDIGAAIACASRSIVATGQLYYACRLIRSLEKGKKEGKEEKEEEDATTTATTPASQKLNKHPLTWYEMDILTKDAVAERFFGGFLPNSVRVMRFFHGLFEEAVEEKIAEKRDRIARIDYRQQRWKLDPALSPPRMWECPRKLTHRQEEKECPGEHYRNYGQMSVSHRLFTGKYQWLEKDNPLSDEWTQETLIDLLQEQLRVTKRERVIGRSKGKMLSAQELLLQALLHALHVEREALWFDYLLMHVRCMHLLTLVQRLVTDFVADYCYEDGVFFEVKEGESLSAFVGKVFIYVDKEEQRRSGVAKEHEKDETRKEKRTSILNYCDHIIRHFLQNESDFYAFNLDDGAQSDMAYVAAAKRIFANAARK